MYKFLEEYKMLTAIVGISWGDEGKGRMVDLLSEKYDVIIRYQKKTKKNTMKCINFPT